MIFCSEQEKVEFIHLFLINLVIVIRNSRLLLGCVDKSVLGANGKTNVFYLLLRDCSELAAAVSMARLARLTSYYLSESIN